MIEQQVSGAVLQVASLREYFRDSMDAALAANHVTVEEDTAYYVVSLLTFFGRSEALYDSDHEGRGHRALAAMLADASDAPTETERLRALQRIGDVALFVAGFLAESLSRTVVDIRYYIDMGGGAYQALATGVGGTPGSRSRRYVFEELAEKFRDLVDVLNEVRDANACALDVNAGQLYESWRTTGSPRAERLLRDTGVHTFAGVKAGLGH
jgi:hypothetical protein